MGGGGWGCPFLPFPPFRGWLSFVCGHLLFLQSQPCRISPALHILIGERFSDFVDTCDLAAYPPTPTSINPRSSPRFKVLNHTTQSLLLCKIILPGSRDQGIDILGGGGVAFFCPRQSSLPIPFYKKEPLTAAPLNLRTSTCGEVITSQGCQGECRPAQNIRKVSSLVPVIPIHRSMS